MKHLSTILDLDRKIQKLKSALDQDLEHYKSTEGRMCIGQFSVARYVDEEYYVEVIDPRAGDTLTPVWQLIEELGKSYLPDPEIGAIRLSARGTAILQYLTDHCGGATRIQPAGAEMPGTLAILNFSAGEWMFEITHVYHWCGPNAKSAVPWQPAKAWLTSAIYSENVFVHVSSQKLIHARF